MLGVFIVLIFIRGFILSPPIVLFISHVSICCRIMSIICGFIAPIFICELIPPPIIFMPPLFCCCGENFIPVLDCDALPIIEIAEELFPIRPPMIGFFERRFQCSYN